MSARSDAPLFEKNRHGGWYVTNAPSTYCSAYVYPHASHCPIECRGKWSAQDGHGNDLPGYFRTRAEAAAAVMFAEPGYELCAECGRGPARVVDLRHSAYKPACSLYSPKQAPR
jgi:hypothetical protein